MVDISLKVKKPLFIGEFGLARLPDRCQEKWQFIEFLTAIETSGAPLAAFWVFNFIQYDGYDDIWNVTFDNDRNYILELIGNANLRMKSNLKQHKQAQQKLIKKIMADCENDLTP
jgi:hypothetical protein